MPRRLLALLVTAPALVLGVGFCFHTSFDPDVLGKYGWSYFAFLAAWFVLVIPGAWLFGLFLFGTQTIRLSRGRVALVRPRVKLLVAAVLGLALWTIGGAIVEHRLRRHTATVHTEVFHPYLQNVPKPGRITYHINEWGFRGDAIARAKNPGTFRIFVLGGSTMYCGDVEFEETHVRRLELALRERYPGTTIEVQNAGVDWHCSAHSLIKLLTWVQDFDPDLIIVCHAVNDLLRSFSPERFASGAYRSDYAHYYGAVANYVDPKSSAWFIFDMYLGYWFSDYRCDRIRVTGPKGDGVNGRKIIFFPKAKEGGLKEWRSLPAFERNMRDLVRIARSKGVEVLVASQPYLYRSDLDPREREVLWFAASHQHNGWRISPGSMADGMAQYNLAAERIASEEGAHFVDLDGRVPKTLEYFYDDVHYTLAGNEAVAHAFFDSITEWGVIDERLRSRSAQAAEGAEPE